jgi:hypothetical protein
MNGQWHDGRHDGRHDGMVAGMPSGTLIKGNKKRV